ncbi:hypothetical protein GmRootV15_24770 [Variovorax sp. V15]
MKGIEPIGLLALHWGNEDIVVRSTPGWYTRAGPECSTLGLSSRRFECPMDGPPQNKAMRFSARHRASKGNQTPILEDAPRPLRIGYIKGVLGKFVGSTLRGYGQRQEPLDTQETHEAFIALIRDEADTWDYDRESSWGALTTHLKDCDWPEFYDFVEMTGKLLIAKDDDVPFGEPEHFEAYQAKVNDLFQEDRIGWSLNDRSELHRQTPSYLGKRMASTGSQLADRFANARVHYQKAQAYLYQHPMDEANSIKEIVSALECVSKALFPKASTLGDAIKLMRKDTRFSTHLLDALERLYVYANATPLVRHGHVQPGKPLLAEAELSLYIGVAYIRYLIAAGEGGSV